MKNEFYNQVLRALVRDEKITDHRLKVAYLKAIDDIQDEIRKSGDEIRLTRLNALNQELESILHDLYNTNVDYINDNLQSTYKVKYYGNMYISEQTLKTNLNFNMVNQRQVEQAVRYKVAGLTFADRLLGFDDIEKINEIVINGIIRGYNSNKIADTISETMDMSLGRARRIARTERGRVSTLANEDSVEQLIDLGINVDEIWLATLDNRTRDRHAELDGQKANEYGLFEIDGYEAVGPGMFGVPEMDVNCRCDVLVVPKEQELTRRKDNISKDIIDYVSFDEWVHDYI